MEPSPHILVVDDSADIREPLAKYLSRKGLRISTASGGVEMKRLLKGNAFDLVVLDIMMPGEDGLTLCRFLRETSEMPVILLTAMVDETDRVVGLEIGADDYVTKPFSPRELLARIRAVLRRSRSVPASRDAAPAKRYRFLTWELDGLRRELVGADAVSVPLSTAEFRLLTVFLQRPQMVLSREQLLDLTAGRSLEPFERSIDNQVSRLRKKIEADPKNPTIIKTVWGGGYVLAAQVTEAAPAAVPP
ncbi:MAG: response regulator [Bauldia sp.]|nr:response regulator [Bauldia sp.]MCW5718211.1 response regulator [Bauldia sp.]